EAAIHGFGWRGPCEYFTRVGSNDLDQVAGQHDCCVSLYRILGVLNAAALHGTHAENADGGQYQGDHHFDHAEASVVAHGDPHNVQLVRAFPSAPLPRSWRMGAPLARTSTTSAVSGESSRQTVIRAGVAVPLARYVMVGSAASILA